MKSCFKNQFLFRPNTPAACCGSIQHATYLLRRLSDSRLLIENMPKLELDNEAMIRYSPAQIEELIEDSDVGLCLDFGHAVKAAVSLGVDYKEYVQGFMGLEPKVFHVSDGTLSEERDEHLGIGDGEYDFGFLMEYIKRSETKMVTIETPRVVQGELMGDIKNLNNIRTYIAHNKRYYIKMK